MNVYGEFEISRLGLVLFLLVICIYIAKINNAWSGKIACFCIILSPFALAFIDPDRDPVRFEASNIYTHLKIQRQAVQDYVRDHGKFPIEEPLLISLAPYLKDKPFNRWMVSCNFLRVTPNAVWMGCDLAEYQPIETFWERNWQRRVANIVIRESIAKRIAQYGPLYGSKDAMSPPVSDDRKSLYRVEDDVVWIRVD